MRPTDFIKDVKGYALSAALLAAMEHDLFPQLEGGPRTHEDLLRALGWEPAVGRPVLDVLEASGYLERSDGKLSGGALITPVLSSYDELKSWAEEMSLTYRSLGELPAVLKSGDVSGTALSRFWAYKSSAGDGMAEDQAAAYSGVMDRSQDSHAEAVLSVLDLSDHRTVLDVGGGSGRFARHLLNRYPDIQVTVIDLPAVIDDARRKAPADDPPGLIFKGGNAFSDDLPQADAVIFNRVLHDWGDEKATALLRNARRAVVRGGLIAAAENIDSGQEQLTPSSATTRLMLAMLGGKRRTVDDMKALFEAAGLQVDEVLPTGHSLTAVIIGTARR